MRRSAQPTRYALVPRVPRSGGVTGVRRYSLARLGPQQRSALGEDRHEPAMKREASGIPAGCFPMEHAAGGFRRA